MSNPVLWIIVFIAATLQNSIVEGSIEIVVYSDPF
jgi:hypothetical protein